MKNTNALTPANLIPGTPNAADLRFQRYRAPRTPLTFLARLARLVIVVCRTSEPRTGKDPRLWHSPTGTTQPHARRPSTITRPTNKHQRTRKRFTQGYTRSPHKWIGVKRLTSRNLLVRHRPAARGALAKYFERVDILEHDRLGASPGSRSGAPPDRHPHGRRRPGQVRTRRSIRAAGCRRAAKAGFRKVGALRDAARCPRAADHKM